MSNGVIYPTVAAKGLNISPDPNGGGSDQSSALQSWLTSLAGGELGILQPGTYGVAASLVFPNNARVLAYGATFAWRGGAAPVLQIGTATAAGVRQLLHGLTIDCQLVANAIAFQFHSTQLGSFDLLEARNAAGTGFELAADASGGGISDFGDQNLVLCHFGRLYNYNCFNGFYLHGASSSSVITNNRFDLLCSFNNVGNACYIQEWCDSNDFSRVVLAVAANSTTGLVLNDSTTVSQGVYNNSFENVSVDAFGVTGVRALTLGPNASAPNLIHMFGTSPSPFAASGTLLTQYLNPYTIVRFPLETPPYALYVGLKNKGSATIAASGTSVVVNHGLAAAPTRVWVQETSNPGLAASIWTDTYTSTQFTIHSSVALTNSTTFDWFAAVNEE